MPVVFAFLAYCCAFDALRRAGLGTGRTPRLGAHLLEQLALYDPAFPQRS
jgi:hypothetical protein